MIINNKFLEIFLKVTWLCGYLPKKLHILKDTDKNQFLT